MKILAIETSCDETAIALVEVKKSGKKAQFKILGNKIATQIALHAQYGGVFPMMAKREHSKNILPVFLSVLKQAKLYKIDKKIILNNKLNKKINSILEREEALKEQWAHIMPTLKNPKIDAIAVTTGPGLEPALWVGISFARALSTFWDIPIIPTNHMEGHIFSIFPKKGKSFAIDTKKEILPMMSLLVSGGHTELVYVKDWMKYKKIGETRDDAAGEAFDKVARMLGLPYPGGPQISKLANQERRYLASRSLSQADEPRRENLKLQIIRADGSKISSDVSLILPRPMIYSKDFNFSFSGLKTAVLYMIRDLPKDSLNEKMKAKIAREFEDAVIDVLTTKTIRAIKEYKIKTLIVGGGVSANTHLQKILKEKIKKEKLKTTLHFPVKSLTTDNALMIAVAGYFQYQNKKFTKSITKVKASGNLSL